MSVIHTNPEAGSHRPAHPATSVPTAQVVAIGQQREVKPQPAMNVDAGVSFVFVMIPALALLCFLAFMHRMGRKNTAPISLSLPQTEILPEWDFPFKCTNPSVIVDWVEKEETEHA